MTMPANIIQNNDICEKDVRFEDTVRDKRERCFWIASRRLARPPGTEQLFSKIYPPKQPPLPHLP
jgi:hypothetical protein